MNKRLVLIWEKWIKDTYLHKKIEASVSLQRCWRDDGDDDDNSNDDDGDDDDDYDGGDENIT